MIPVSLYIKNFLSYGEDVPPLDFTEFNVACLSGNNGHGKSAILDALTWALWGEARKAAGEKSPADGLLRIGTTEMQVEFVFDLEGDRFRVLRKFQRKKGKSKSTTLDFQVFDESGNSYRSLTEKTARVTQGKIDATLRMNYDTFINSAFILQGRVDEFTKKTPRKRKEILAEILDLLRYDQLAEIAKKHHREAEKQTAVLEDQLKTIETELQHKEEYEQQLAQLATQLKDIDQRVDTQTAKRQTLEKQLAELRGKQAQINDRQQQQNQLHKELQQLKERTQRQQMQIAGVRKILDREENILEQFKRYGDLQNQNNVYEEKLQQHSACQTQKNQLEQTIQQARHQLEKRLGKFQTEQRQIQKSLDENQRFLQRSENIEKGFQELQTARKQDETWEEARNEAERLDALLRGLEKTIEQQKGQLTVELQSLKRHIGELHPAVEQQQEREQRLEQARQAMAQLESLEQEREQNKEAGTECRAQVDQLKIQQQRLQESHQETLEKLELLKRSESPQCPLCSSSLEGRKKDELEQHFQQEVQQIKEEDKQLNQRLKEQTRYLEELRAQYRQLEKQIKKLQKSREQYIQAEKALEDSRKAAKQFKELEQQQAVLQKKIEDKDFAQEEHDQLKVLQEALTALVYNKKEHQSLKKRLKTLMKFEGEYSRLEDGRVRQEKLLAQLPEIEREIARGQRTIQEQDFAHSEQAQLQDIIARIAEIAYDEKTHASIRKGLQQLQNVPTQQAELEHAQKSLPALQQTLDELLTEQQNKTESLTQLETQIQELEKELGALPDITRELNESTIVLQKFRQERDRLLQARGTYQNKYEHCQRLESEAKEKSEEKQKTDKDCRIYGHLVRIFGKDGMQAYLIENAIPEIEDEANEILARLTDNRTHISIESVKDLQKGGTKETLDIKISDELGTRSYEMYSGGEAFRVDFAIRIALSKLLAKRAGTKLKTLVIDEGFGTQDAHGLEQLVEAIKTISSDFEKILVITHLEGLKDAFPVRIEVVKLPDIGSQYQIVH